MSLADRMSAVVGAEHVISDGGELAFYADDLVRWERPASPAFAVRPGSAEDVAVIARMARSEGLTLVPRGAGLSYTGGVVPNDGAAIVLDLTRLNTVEVDEDNLLVRVGAGTSWLSLAQKLSARGLRPLQLGPISGEYSTVAGAVSQNVPGNLDGVAGLQVVLADGTIVETGAASVAGGTPFYRHFGPDLTGLFCGDCGVFGIKTAVSLRLIRERAASFASFSFAEARELASAMAQLAAAGLGVRLFGMDPQKNSDAVKVDARTALHTTLSVIRKARGPIALVRDLAQLASAPRRMNASGWTLHITAEAPTQIAADSILNEARALLRGKGREIDNVLPKTLHAKPYSVRGFVGRDGERWVPIHGMLPMGEAVPAISALQSYFVQQAGAMSAAGISLGYFFTSFGPYVSMEPMFYWRDALSPIHMRYLSERNRARFANRPDNPQARALVERLRSDVRAIFRSHGALHAQLARYYPYLGMLNPGAAELARRIKHALDPAHALNRGALDF